MRPIEAQTLFSSAWSEPNRLSESSWRVCAHALNFHCLQVTISYQTKKSHNMIIGQQSNNYLLKTSSLPRGFNGRSLVDCKLWLSKFGRLQVVCNWPLSYTFGNPGRKRHMSRKESPFAVNYNLWTWSRYWFKNRMKRLVSVAFCSPRCFHCRVLVAFCSKCGRKIHRLLRYIECSLCVLNGITLMSEPWYLKERYAIYDNWVSSCSPRRS